MITGQDIAPLWRVAFGAGFLAAASFGKLAMIRGLLWLSWRVSAVRWIVVFCIFLYRYVPVLTRPMADGRAG